MRKRGLRALSALLFSLTFVAGSVGPGIAQAPSPPGRENSGTVLPAASIPEQNDELEARLLLLDQQFISTRTAGDTPLSVAQATALRKAASDQAKALKNSAAPGPTTFAAGWSALGPNPIIQNQRSDGSNTAESGRIGALAIRKSNGQFILGAAQGGIWLYNPTTQKWSPKTDTLASTAIGALAIAPSSDNVVYAGTGEGALSGDSYYGNGILKSTDGGNTWAHVSGDYFVGVSTSRLAVDPNDPNHLYAAILRGRGGDRRVSPPIHSTFGIWESRDGAATWTLRMAAPAVSLGATDIRLDPRHPTTLYASFWSDKIYKSTDGGASWNPIMNGLPTDADFAAGLTRFALGLSHPASAASATLYTGFDWVDTAGHHHAGRIFKSTDDGASWTEMPTGTAPFDTVLDYCGTQCFYDNVVEPDPTNPDVVFVAGSFGYNMPIPSGGVFRSEDGGLHWTNLGWNMHPDFHALAFDLNDTHKVLIGNDGGVWYSTARGGRNGAGASDLSAVDWLDLNGSVTPGGGVLGRTGLQISQFTSIAAVPQMLVPIGLDTQRFWGGTQDNGTLRKSVNSQSWFDTSSGDGGQVVVNQTDRGTCGLSACYVYGTYFGVSLYRFTDGGGTFTNRRLTNGINGGDRSEFYIPVVLNQLNTNQLFTATYRLYRTDNAKAPDAGDVHFKTISGDLTSGCTGAAPNGARGCFISAIGIGGGTAVYTGSDDGVVYFSPDAMVSDTPTWTRVDKHDSGNGFGDKHSLPNRPVAWIAVDRSNYRVAYIAYNGYNAATPHQPGHVFKTTDAGGSWTDISGNLPDNPVNSLTVDPSFPNTLYAATDVGPFVSYNGGANWGPLGSGIPTVAVDQIDLDSYDRVIAAGTHGRGAWSLKDATQAPALVISKVDAGVPVGPGSNIDYTITVRNIGNAAATGVTVTDPIPANTSFVSAGEGGVNNGGTVQWSGLSLASAGSASVHLTVRIDPGLKSGVTSVVDDGFRATSAQGPSADGSPTVTPIAPPFAASLAPASQTDGARVGTSVTDLVTITNHGYKTDTYTVSATGGTFPVSFRDSTCTANLTTTPAVVAGASTSVCVKVDVPAAAADSATSTATITATSTGSPTLSVSGTDKTIAVAVDTLVVDDDAFADTAAHAIDVNSYYTAALNNRGIQFQLWDLGTDKNLPLNYMKAFRHIVWFTGNSFPAPIGNYESKLKSYLDGGGHLFVSGQDLLDGPAGTSTFVHDYLHVTWNGSETQNDKATNAVHEVAGSLTAGVGVVPLNAALLGNTFMDRITPNGAAQPIFIDDSSATDALSFSGTYKVVFMAFPFEEYGTADQRAELVRRVFAFFGP